MSKKQRIKKRDQNFEAPASQKQEPLISKPNNNKILWITLGVIIFAQVIFTLNSMNQIRYEELAESVRNVYWLEHNTVYDGTSSNIGWYGSLLIFYNTFGFSIHSAKFFRLLLDILSLVCIALMLKKYFSPKQAIVPLLAIGLSPTLLYITTMQHSHGIDLQYAPIVLYLLLSLSPSVILRAKPEGSSTNMNLEDSSSTSSRQNDISHFGFVFKSVLLWMVAMIAWMSYPTFAFYLPPLALLFIWQSIRQAKKVGANTVVIALFLSSLSFFTPLLIGLSYLKDPQLILYDTVTKSGIFRGAGSFNFEFSLFFTNIIGVLNDLFKGGQSYHFETAQGDFSYYLPALSVLVVFGLALSIWKIKNLRIFVAAALLLIFSNLIISGFTIDPSYQPGIRRATGALFGFYALYVLAWGYVIKHTFKSPQLILIIILILIPLHHLLVFPQNLSGLSFPSQHAETQWFKINQTPSKSLDVMIDAVTKDELKLGCKDPSGEGFTACRYSEAFAAVSGYCTWNDQSCNFISGYDLQTKQQLHLSVDLWENYQIQH